MKMILRLSNHVDIDDALMGFTDNVEDWYDKYRRQNPFLKALHIHPKWLILVPPAIKVNERQCITSKVYSDNLPLFALIFKAVEVTESSIFMKISRSDRRMLEAIGTNP